MSAAAARHAAARILSEGRFHQPGFPRPLHGALVSVGKAVSSPLHWVRNAVNDLADALPGGVGVVWALLGIVVVIASVLLARRAARLGLLGAAAGLRSEPRAVALERAADRAEAAGRLAEAVRLRFQAGLARLREREAIPSAQTTPTRDVAQLLESATFDAIAHRFDEIAYGDGEATSADVEQQRRGWAAILGRGS